MENRKKLHYYGLVLIVLGILNLVTFVTTLLADCIDGTLAEALATVEPDILVAVKVVLGIFGVIVGLMVAADVFLGVKALKISKAPKADRGYIIVANVFFVMSVLAAVSHAGTLLNGSAPVLDTVLNLVNAILGAIVYVLFVKAARAVRQDVLDGKN